MDTTALDPLIGQLLDGRYRIDTRIAVGGMATVYRAVDTRLDRVLALKVMHPSLAADDVFVERFIREAKSAARLSHPNVVGVFDQGNDGTYVYLAMEYVAGCTLRDVLRERGALQPRAALDILEPVLAALGAAHRAGLVHRDMKPENVLIGDDGRVKVADFGLVRAVDTHTRTTGAVLGTVSYLSPEQIEHGTADPRVDVYACGMTLYEMLTGGKAYRGGTPAQIIYQHLHEDVPAPSAAVPGLAPELDALVARATARDPGRRPGDAVELLAETRITRAALTDDQLDAVPPQAAGRQETDGTPVGSEDPTGVVPRPAAPDGIPPVPLALPVPATADDDQLHRTSRLELPPGPPPAPAPMPGTGGTALLRRRPLLAVLLGLLLVITVGAGIWYINSGQFTQTPGVLAKSEAEARKILGEAGLGVKVEREYSDTVRRGRVIESDPEPGGRIRDTGTVTITVSDGPEIVKVPSLTGETLQGARKQLGELGLTPGKVTREFHADIPQGSVIRTEPGAGEQRRPKAAVDLVVSKGLPVPVPQVLGMAEGSARQLLQEAGFAVKTAEQQIFSEYDAGTVAEQSIAAGDEAAAGDVITLTVSKGPDLVTVPSVEGMSQDEAREALEAAGFDVTARRIFFGDTVFDQSPDAGDTAPRGSDVTIWVR